MEESIIREVFKETVKNVSEDVSYTILGFESTLRTNVELERIEYDLGLKVYDNKQGYNLITKAYAKTSQEVVRVAAKIVAELFLERKGLMM